jgi:hypothetical protein
VRVHLALEVGIDVVLERHVLEVAQVGVRSWPVAPALKPTASGSAAWTLGNFCSVSFRRPRLQQILDRKS